MRSRNKITVLAVAIPVLFVLTAATPASVLGCFNRGLIAFSLALLGAAGALVLAASAVYRQMRFGERRLPLGPILLMSIPAIYVVLFER